MSEFGDQLTKWRNARGLSMNGLAAKVGVSHSFVSRIEAGKSEPSIDVARRFAHALGVDEEEAVTWWLKSRGSTTPGERAVENEEARVLVEYYEGSSEEDRKFLLGLAKRLREENRRNSLGGGTETRTIEHTDGSVSDPES